MSDNIRSMLLAPGGMYLLLAVALVLTLVRPHRRLDVGERDSLINPLLLGIASQCVHMVEEFITGFHVQFPELIGLRPITSEFFIAINVLLIGIWLLAVIGFRNGVRVAYFPIWFLVLGMCINGIAHPLLAVMVTGYFPGLITSPIVGIMGILIAKRLFQLTGSPSKRISFQ